MMINSRKSSRRINRYYWLLGKWKHHAVQFLFWNTQTNCTIIRMPSVVGVWVREGRDNGEEPIIGRIQFVERARTRRSQKSNTVPQWRGQSIVLQCASKTRADKWVIQCWIWWCHTTIMKSNFAENKSGTMTTETALDLLQAAAAEIDEESEVSIPWWIDQVFPKLTPQRAFRKWRPSSWVETWMSTIFWNSSLPGANSCIWGKSKLTRWKRYWQDLLVMCLPILDIRYQEITQECHSLIRLESYLCPCHPAWNHFNQFLYTCWGLLFDESQSLL